MDEFIKLNKMNGGSVGFHGEVEFISKNQRFVLSLKIITKNGGDDFVEFFVKIVIENAIVDSEFKSF
jgi:hypothetical protein